MVGVQKWGICLPVLLLPALGMVIPSQRCERGGPPPGVQGAKADPRGRFTLNITADNYVPGNSYMVTLSGIRSTKFVGFTVHVEGGGSLSVFDSAQTKYSESCQGTITHTNTIPKSEVEMAWAAPSRGTGCVTFRATVIEDRDLWFQDDGPLSKSFCEDSKIRDGDQLPVNEKCCACDEAKYEVTFEGLWSRHTHPKDFPSNTSNLPRFSDVIGASHTTEYRFWEYGGIASEGLKQVAERGSTRMLESELKSQSQHIRTIIKARGISYPNVTGKTFAVFRVDKKHHLISLVSMIDPSPDWIVGVSRLELCLSDCSWLERQEVPLYPWDVGTDSGITYTSPDFPTEQRDHIRLITSSFPNDPRSPFFDPSGEKMKPLAKLYLTRQRLYEKSCSPDIESYSDEAACEVGEWSEWSRCSVTCGTGKKSRQRFYKDELRAQMKNCNTTLTSRSVCSAPTFCGGGSNVRPPPDELDFEPDGGACEMTEWSLWSGCSVGCGQGEKHRFRNLKNKRNWKLCMGLQTPPATSQDDICYDNRTCPEAPGDSEPSPEPLIMKRCDAETWSKWSACSVTCGLGRRTRVRVVHGHCPRVQQSEVISCIENATCTLSSKQAREACQMPKVVGPCRGHFEKWFFDAMTQSCYKFAYSGCGGNRNQFGTKEECEEICKELKEELIANRTARLKQLGVSLTGSILSNGDMEQEFDIDEATTRNLFNDIQLESFLHTVEPDDYYTVTGTDGPVVDCEVTHWTAWSPCSVSCGKGYRERTRHIVVHAKNGGRVCPRKLLKRRRCNSGPCNIRFEKDHNYSQMEDYDESSYRVSDDCVYSEWSNWSLCSVSCGSYSIKQRTRSVDYLRSSLPSACKGRIEYKECHVQPCRSYYS